MDTLLSFLGTDLKIVRAEGLALGPDARNQAMERALEELQLVHGAFA